MKLSFVFITICVSSVFAVESHSQSAKVSVYANNLEVKEVINQIESQTDFLFVYNNDQVDLSRKVSVDAKDVLVSEVLSVVFDESDVVYIVEGNNVLLMKKPMNIQSQQSGITVSGTVTDSKGETLPGAVIIAKDEANNVATTDIDGKYTISINDGTSLEFSYIGYETQTVNPNGKSVLNVVLEEDSEMLEEVVVVGYGTQKKINLTGAVETIDSEMLENRPIRSATDALQGAVSGLIVQSGNGQPGSFATFKIRGNTSVNSAGALVIIDGMPGDINLVNPQDIESISVLKDAASAAIYGARAAEGVILVTTKQGESDKVRIEYSGNVSFNQPTHLPESNNGLSHALLSNQAFTNASLPVLFTEDAIAAIKDPNILALPKGDDWIYTSDMDWISTMMDNSFQQTHNVSISKASDGLKYLFSVGWMDQNGMFAEYGPDNYDRMNLRSNVSVDILKDKLTLDSKITYLQTNKQYHPQFGGWSIPYMTFIQSGPNMPVYDPNGNYSRYRMQANPIQALQEGGEGKNKQQTVEGVFTLSYKPVKGLTLRAIGGAKILNRQIKEWRREYGKYGPNGLISMGAGQAGPNKIIQKAATTQYLTGQLLAEYNLKVNKHEMTVLGGWSAEENNFEELEAMRINIIGNELPAIDLGATEGWTNDANNTSWALLSGFMRLNYAYASKYLLEVNFRADASSRFSAQNKWGIFPSASVAWRMTEEAFMQDQKVFDNIKFRASWGQLGNQNGLGLYDHIPQYVVSGYYPFLSGLGQWASVTKLPSSSRTWETVEMKNIAVELGFLSNRLTVTAEYFIKNNKNMLVNIEIPSVIGIDVPTGNYGELEVKGWDLSIGWRDGIDDFSYSAQFNLSDQRDELVDYGVEYAGFVSGVNKKVQGYSLGSIFGYKTDGYFTSEQEVAESAVVNRSVVGVGDIKYIDKDGDGKISAPNDLEYLGSTNPRFVFSLNLSANWRNFDLGILFQGVGKRNYYLDREIMAPFSVTWGNFSYDMHNDYWTPENPDASLPRHYAGSSHNYQTSDHWLQDASYIRLKNLQFGYTLPETWLKKIRMERVRIYFSGENLFTLSKLNKNFDPELSATTGYAYPIMRSFSFGLNITL